MPVFSYKAVDGSGQTVTGELDAPDRRQAVRRLTSQNIRPLTLSQSAGQAGGELAVEAIDFFQAEKKTRAKRRLFRRHAKSKQSLQFLKRLLVLLSAGMPLGDTMKLLSVRLSDPELKELANSLWRKLSEGSTLAGAMREMPSVFHESTVHLVAAGEASGNLVPILERVVAHMEEMSELRGNIRSSLAYPLFICVVALGVVVFFLTYLLPKIRGMLESLGGEMPVYARLLIISSDFALKYGPAAAIAAVFAAAALKQWRRAPKGRQMTDLWLLRLPFFGNIYLYNNIFATSSLMATLLGSGVNTTEALRLVERTINNVILKAKFANCRKQIQEGVNIATAMRRVKYMPDLAMDILTVGENTGNIVASLNDINKIYRNELTNLLSFLTGVISTGALVCAFLLVVVIALTIVSSIFSVSASLTA